MLANKTNTAEGKSAVQQQNAETASSNVLHYKGTSGNLPDLEVLLQQVNLAELAAQAGAKLHSSGRELRGPCPLHGGKNPSSFSIFTAENGHQRWYCHSGCQTGGDALDFVQRWKNLDFAGALRFLAEQTGLDVGTFSMGAGENHQRTSLFTRAAQFFALRLWSAEGLPAREYLLKRGFTEKTLREAGWGFTKSDVGLSKHLKESGIELTLAKEIGLIRKDHGDFTANGNGQVAAPEGYIIYPHSWHGQVNYFSARALNPVDLNDKSRNLPGERQVYWAPVAGDANLVIVEGQADAESLHQVGFSALALCGLGRLPETELSNLKKRKVIYLALDNDQHKTGLSANEQEKIRQRQAETTTRLCEVFGPLTMLIRDLPFKDPNEWLQNGLEASAWRKHQSAASPWLEVLIEQARLAPPVEQAEQIRNVLDLLAGLPETLQARYSNQLERKLGLTRRDLRRMMKQSEQAAYAEIKERRLHFMGEPLGNFWARITNELSVDDGLNPVSVRYLVQGGLETGEPLLPVTVDAQNFARLDWIPSQWGMRPIQALPPGKAHLLGRAIQEVSLEEVVRERLFTFTGWVEREGRRGYLTASGLLTADGLDGNIRVDLGANNLRHYALPDPPRDQTARQLAVRASLDFLFVGPHRITVPLWAAMYAAPLTVFRSLNAVMNIYGTTQSGKSTISHLALTHFGPGFIQSRDYHAPIDWSSTMTAIEYGLFTTQDAPIIVDDFAPQFASLYEANEMRRKATLVVRSVGNRSARSRGRADLSQQPTRFPRGLALMTAENPLVGQSIVGRLVYVPISPGEILPDPTSGEHENAKLAILQTQAEAGLLAQAMALYIQYLAANWDKVQTSFPKMVDEASEQARREKQLQNRLPDAFGVLQAAQELALNAFAELGLLSAVEVSRLVAENRVALLELVIGQAERVAAESPVRKLFEALGSLLERRKAYLAPRTKSIISYEPPLYAEQIGYFEPGNAALIYLRTEICLAQAKAFWRTLDENLDILPDALRRQLSQVPGLLAEKDARQTEVPKYCGSSNQRVLVVDARKVFDLYAVTLANLEI